MSSKLEPIAVPQDVHDGLKAYQTAKYGETNPFDTNAAFAWLENHNQKAAAQFVRYNPDDYYAGIFAGFIATNVAIIVPFPGRVER